MGVPVSEGDITLGMCGSKPNPPMLMTAYSHAGGARAV